MNDNTLPKILKKIIYFLQRFFTKEYISDIKERIYIHEQLFP